MLTFGTYFLIAFYKAYYFDATTLDLVKVLGASFTADLVHIVQQCVVITE